MPRAAPDIFFSQLILDYLATDESQAAGIPDADALPRTILDAGLVQRVPALIISAQEQSGGSHAKRCIHVLCVILFQNRSHGDDAANDAASLQHSTERVQAAEWLDVIESRIMDRAALGEFIKALPDERRDGFRIQKTRRLPQPNLERKTNVKLELFCAFEIDVVWYPQAA